MSHLGRLAGDPVSPAPGPGRRWASRCRAIRTLKEQFLWVRRFPTIEELRVALAEFSALYDATWLRERRGRKTPNQIRAEQRGLETEAATVRMAA